MCLNDYMFACVCIYLNVSECVRMCLNVYMFACVCIYLNVSNVFECLYVCMCLHVFVYI